MSPTKQQKRVCGWRGEINGSVSCGGRAACALL